MPPYACPYVFPRSNRPGFPQYGLHGHEVDAVMVVGCTPQDALRFGGEVEGGLVSYGFAELA